MSLILIDKLDEFEVVRDQIAAILVNEVANQKLLAAAASQDPALWDLKVYSERSNPWERWIDPDNSDDVPIVNVRYDDTTFVPGGSNIMERQKGEATYHIDVFARGAAADDELGPGHQPGDLAAALTCHRALRLVRNILMAAENTYLQLRTRVGRRWIQSVTVFQPQIDNRAVEQVVGARITLRVDINEFSPQTQPETLELLSATVRRTEDGQIVLVAEYDYT